MRLFKALKHTLNSFLLILISSRIGRILPTKFYLKAKFFLMVGYSLNLNNPSTFNEKLQWLKVYGDSYYDSNYVDKSRLAETISDVVDSSYFIPVVGIFNSFQELSTCSFPEKFVIKPSHLSGEIIICRDKKQFQLSKYKSRIDKWLKSNYYWLHREKPYKNITPRIIVEHLIEDESGDLRDYKIMCFNGKVMCSFVCSNRHNIGGLQMDFFDREWSFMNFTRKYQNSSIPVSKPSEYDKLLNISEKIAARFPFVRVDFYLTSGKIYIGELTFFPGSGFEKFEPLSYDYLLGSWLNIDLLPIVR